MIQWLGQHSHIIGHLTAEIYLNPTMNDWSLQGFITAAVPCKSLSLELLDDDDVPLNISCIADVAHSLVSLDFDFDQLAGITALTCLTRLSELRLNGDLTLEEPWVPLAGLTGLSKLSLTITGHGDPSPLSALTRLRSMSVVRQPIPDVHENPPFAFSSLQSLSMMLQLEHLNLSDCCTATSLEGLRGLSSLRDLSIRGSDELCSLEGLGVPLTSLKLGTLRDLKSMAGIEAAVGLQQLSIRGCSITSLQSLAALKSLASLLVSEDGVDVGHLVSLEGIEGLSSCLEKLTLVKCSRLSSLVGLEKLSVLRLLTVRGCGINSLQPVADMSVSLSTLIVEGCKNVQEDVQELPEIHLTTFGKISESNVKKVLVAGKVHGGISVWQA